MKKTIKAIAETVKYVFIVFCLFIVSLFFRQQRLPGEWVGKICERFSSDDIVISCDYASFGFAKGFHFANLRVYDRTRKDSLKPVCSAEALSVWPITRRVRVVGAKYLRLPDSYYSGGGDSDGKGAGGGIDGIELPEIPSFSLELVRPDILGVAPEKVTAEVSVEKRKIDVRTIRLEWPDQDHLMWLGGYCTVDFERGKVVGEVGGTARQEHIRPLLSALEIRSAFPYMGGFPETGTSGFTEVIGPVPASCSWDVDLRSPELKLELDLHPVMGRYNNVRLQRADGRVGVHWYQGESGGCYDITVGPLTAIDPNGRRFGGVLTVHGTNDLNCLEFDAYSQLEKQNTLDIMGCLNKGTLDAFRCLTPAKVTAKGMFNCDDVNIANNDFGGRVEVEKANLLNHDLSSVAFDYRLEGSEISITNVTAKGVTGGDVSGWARLHVPLAEGDGDFHGRGSIATRNGRLVRIPMFLALTKALADNVPGIDRLVNQSEARCDFTISNGVFRTRNLVVQGSLFCLKINGSCNLVTDDLDFIVHCTVMKEESTLGKYLIQPVLWPFTKLLTEFEVSGKVDDPVLHSTSFKSIKETTGEIIKKVFD